MRRILSILLLFMAVLTATADRGGFYYKNISYKAVVHPNNKWDVTETFDVVFNEPRHGIYRYLPLEFSLYHNVNGEKQYFRYDPNVYDVSVDDYNYETKIDGDNKIIRIGDEDTEVTGEHRYVIHYTYDYPDDRLRTKDYLFHTILGTDFGEEIKQFDFEITFEKPISVSTLDSLEMYGGSYGSTDIADDIEVYIDDSTIYGTAYDIAPNHGFTLFCNLPEGYFEGVDVKTDGPLMFFFNISVFLMGLFIIVALFKRNNHTTKQIEFYPPDGISSAEVGTIIDDSVDPVDLASLIPWFASKGYIRIKELTGDGFVGRKAVLQLSVIKKIPSTAPEYQRLFWQALFGSSTVVRTDGLAEKPEKITDAIKKLKGMYQGREGDANDRSLQHQSLWVFMLVPIGLFSTLAFLVSSTVSFFDELVLCLSLFGWTASFYFSAVLFRFLAKGDKVRSKKTKLIINICILACAAVGYAIFDLILIGNNSFFTRPMLITLFTGGFICTTLTGRFLIDTPYRAQVMGKLLGLKEFIETAEKPRLESLLQDDPEYFYKIVPYALVFGLTDKWAKQFEGISMQQPDWYDASSVGTFHLANSINTLCSTANSAITTVSHDSSAASGNAFSSGGGFSGGGGGGGGGGSW